MERFLAGRQSRYRLVEQRALVGIVLFVYVKEKFFAEGAVKDVQVRYSSSVQQCAAVAGMIWYMHRLERYAWVHERS